MLTLYTCILPSVTLYAVSKGFHFLIAGKMPPSIGKNSSGASSGNSRKWAKCKRNWIKINKEMKDIGLSEFGMPDDFIDLRDIVKSHTEQDSSWVEELAKVADTVPGQVRQFMEHPIKARAMLQQLSASLVKYRAHAVEIREIYLNPMEQHRFPYANTCEELFINGRSTRRVTLLSDILR
jgi:hypothetical protein